EDTVQDLTTVIDKVPAAIFPAACYWRGQLYRISRRNDEALKDLTEAAKHPDFYEARAALARIWFDDFKFDQAGRMADEVLRTAPDCVDAMSLKAFIKFLGGTDPKLWKADFELAIKLEPSDDSVQSQYRELLNELKGPEHLGCKFKKEMPHYIIMTDMSMEKTKLYGERLEAAY